MYIKHLVFLLMAINREIGRISGYSHGLLDHDDGLALQASTRRPRACPCPNAEPIAYDYIFTINVRWIGLYHERTRKVSSGSEADMSNMRPAKAFIPRRTFAVN